MLLTTGFSTNELETFIPNFAGITFSQHVDPKSNNQILYNCSRRLRTCIIGNTRYEDILEIHLCR